VFASNVLSVRVRKGFRRISVSHPRTKKDHVKQALSGLARNLTPPAQRNPKALHNRSRPGQTPIDATAVMAAEGITTNTITLRQWSAACWRRTDAEIVLVEGVAIVSWVTVSGPMDNGHPYERRRFTRCRAACSSTMPLPNSSEVDGSGTRVRRRLSTPRTPFARLSGT
jgi:hypothetical protein